jgi:long-chain fatty acid transport protein
VSGILAYQTFEAKGIENFAGFSADSTKLSDNGEDTSTGFGLRLGVSMEVAEGITVGAAYQPVMDMSPFDSYAGLFAEQGDFDIPSNYAVGAAWKSDQLVLAFDYMVINYTDVASVSNSVNSILTGSLLGDSDGPGFGWTDIMVIKIGAAYTLSDAWTIRGGINHGDNPIPEGETLFNILAPGVVEDHITAGFTWTLSPDSELNFAFMHAFEGSVTGDEPAGLGGGTTTLKMDQNEFELSYGLKL